MFRLVFSGEPLDSQPREQQRAENRETVGRQLPSDSGELDPNRKSGSAGRHRRDAGSVTGTDPPQADLRLGGYTIGGHKPWTLPP